MGHLVIEGDQVSQAGPAFHKPMLTGPDHLLVLYVPHDGTQDDLHPSLSVPVCEQPDTAVRQRAEEMAGQDLSGGLITLLSTRFGRNSSCLNLLVDLRR